MDGSQGSIVGREAELEAVRSYIDAITDGPASLVLEGPAGIGKTAIWSQAVLDSRAKGFAVRTSRCSVPEGRTAPARCSAGRRRPGCRGRRSARPR